MKFPKNAIQIDLNETQFSGVIRAAENKATSWVITRTGLDFSYEDSVTKAEDKDFRIRALISIADYKSGELLLVNGKNTPLKFEITDNFKVTALEELDTGTFDLYWNDTLVEKSLKLKQGGVYTIVGYMSKKIKALKVLTITPENAVHMLWLIPQYVVITLGEVMFSITGLEFAFTQAPVSMKSLLQAAWLLTVAIGNLVVIIIAETSLMKQVNLF